MKDVTGIEMCIAMYKQSQTGCLHRFWSVEENAVAYQKLIHLDVDPWASVGFEKDRLAAIADVYARAVVVVDVAHGNSQAMVDFLKYSQSNHPRIRLIAGNFVEWPSQVLDQVKPIYGIKIGIGGGSACSTRSVTGHGYPQLQAIMDTYRGRDSSAKMIIADGGCRSSGDIAKAIAAGADRVMLGGMLAFTDACGNPNRYAGSASLESYEENGKSSNFRTPEGVSQTKLEITETTDKRLQDILNGLRSAFSYSDSINSEEFMRKAELVKVSSGTQLESSTRSWK
jgi:IMP dehydrogenase